MTAAAPSNPITPLSYTGFQFVPKQDYYQSFQAGVLARLAVSRTQRFLCDTHLPVSICCCHISRPCRL